MSSPKKQLPSNKQPTPEVRPQEVREVQEILNTLPPEKRQKIEAVLLRTEQSIFSSPIPPPEVLSGYNDAITNGAERILVMAEQQAAHRRE